MLFKNLLHTHMFLAESPFDEWHWKEIREETAKKSIKKI